MGTKIDNLGRLIHDITGIFMGVRSFGVDTFMPVILAQSGVAVSLTGTVAETTLAGINIPGGLMGPNGVVRVYSTWSFTSSTNAKTLRARLGGLAGAAYMVSAQTSAGIITAQFLTIINNRGAANSQVGAPSNSIGLSSGGGNGAVTSAIDTTADSVFALTGQLASAGESITLQSYIIEVLPG